MLLLLASLAVHMGVPELAQRADRVVHGTVTAQRSFWQDGRIVTRSTLRVSEWLKGPKGAVEVDTLGGAVDDLAQDVPGEARLAKDEEVVLFLVKASGALRVLGLAQGKFHVEGKRVMQDLSGLHDESQPTTLRALKADVARNATRK
jgi:hypothetical protein